MFDQSLPQSFRIRAWIGMAGHVKSCKRKLCLDLGAVWVRASLFDSFHCGVALDSHSGLLSFECSAWYQQNGDTVTVTVMFGTHLIRVVFFNSMAYNHLICTMLDHVGWCFVQVQRLASISRTTSFLGTALGSVRFPASAIFLAQLK